MEHAGDFNPGDGQVGISFATGEREGSNLERAWIIISGLCLVAAALFAWRSNLDAAFVTATLGCVAWFLSLRQRLRRTIIAAEESAMEEEQSDSGDQDED